MSEANGVATLQTNQSLPSGAVWGDVSGRDGESYTERTMAHETSSSAQPPAETSWTEIEDLLDHLAQRAGESISAQEFYTELLDQAVPALAAVAGGVWVINPQDQMELVHEVRLRETEISASEDAIESHTAILNQAIAATTAFSVPPGSGMPQQNGQPPNPTDWLILLAPIRAEDKTIGVLEIFQRANTTPAAQQGFLRFLETLTDIASDFVRHQELRNLRDRASLWGQYENFVERIHASLDLDRTAFVLANDGRGLIECDRASVLMVKSRRKCQVKAVSGQDSIDRRANGVRLLEQLCVAVVKTGEPLWYDDTVDDLPPQIEAPLQNYLDEAHTRAVAVVPLKDPVDEEEPFSDRPPFAAFVAERFDADPNPDRTKYRVEAVSGHGAAALRNALTHRELPLFPVMKAVQNAGWYVKLRNLPKTVFVLGLIAAAIAALILVPAEFTVSGEGELQPKVRRDVFAWSDGVVENVFVMHGKDVKLDQPVAEMRSTELDYEISRVLADKRNAEVRLATVKALMPKARQTDRQQFLELSAEEREIPKLIASLDRQLDILDEKKSELTIKSPIAGRVLTWDVDELLRNRPVSRGQILMTVAEVSGPWVVEIRVPDEEIGHVLAAQKTFGEDLHVDFLLATDPETTYTGKVERVSLTTEPDENAAASVLVTVSFDKEDIPELRPGATVIPKIHCGKKPVGYVWFHGVIDAVKTYILF